MKKLFYFITVTNFLLFHANVFSDPLPTEKIAFEPPIFSESTRLHRDPYGGKRILYASAHSAGALAIAGATVVPLIVGALASYPNNNSGPIVAGVIGSGCAFAGGLYATKALGGSRTAIVAGCLAGLITTVLYPDRPGLAIPVTAAVAGTIAAFEY